MKNLVMGVAAGYGWNDLEPFINSFKKNCPDAALVFFIDDISDFTLKRLKEENLILINVPSNLKNNLIINARWEMYKNFLEEHTEYENIFVTDVRDVIFQGDVFKAYSNYKNSLIYSTESVIIKNDPVTSQWIKDFLGTDKYLKIQDEIAVCMGMIFATREEMIILLDKIVKSLRTSTNWGDDQAAINYLIYNKILPIENIFPSDTENGELFNMYWANNRRYGNLIIRGDGKAPAVVHEYDRCPEMLQVFDEIYREKDFNIDKNFTDVSSAIDQIFCLIQRKKWNNDAKFLQNCIMKSPDLNSYAKKLLKLRDMLKKVFM